MMHMQDLWRGQFADPRCAGSSTRSTGGPSRAAGTPKTTMRAWRSPSPRGACARDLDDEQRHTLRQLLAVYTGRAPRDLAGAYTARYESDPVLDEVYFAWAGSTDAGEPHY